MWSLLKKAAEALDIPHTIGQLKLFKVKDGIIILDHEIESGGVSHAWTIGLYCTLVAKKRPSLLKIGVGYVLNEEKEVGI